MRLSSFLVCVAGIYGEGLLALRAERNLWFGGITKLQWYFCRFAVPLGRCWLSGEYFGLELETIRSGECLGFDIH
jgi:hypothetical protein